jgi:hypothetical protein
MDFDFIIGLVSRWFHILAAIAAVGGTIFARFVVLPSLETLPPGQRDELHAKMRARWSKIVAIAIALLLISGLYNIAMIEMRTTTAKDTWWYHPVLTAAAQKLRQNAKFWMNLNIVLAVILVGLSGLLRTAPHLPKAKKTLETAPAFQPGEPSLPVIEPGTSN